MKYNLFIGRYQSPHKGHQQIFDTYLSKGLPVLIAVRDVVPDKANPLPSWAVQSLWEEVYRDNPLVRVIIIPDIETVNYGRGVGYEVKEIKVDDKIASISATDIRNQIMEGEEGWKEFVDERIHIHLEEAIRTAEYSKRKCYNCSLGQQGKCELGLVEECVTATNNIAHKDYWIDKDEE